MRFYLCFSTILVCSNIVLQCWGRFHAHDSPKLGCSPNGYQWLYNTTFSELFITAHIVQIIMQAVMLEKALYKVPHEAGLFGAPENVEFSDESDGEEEEAGEAQMNKGKDDDYQKI